MQFPEDSVSDFIRYKLNNPQVLEKEMKLIEDRKECTRKLEESTRQMEAFRNELASHNSILDTLTERRSSLQETFAQDVGQLEEDIQDSRDRTEQTRRETKEKQNSSGKYLR